MLSNKTIAKVNFPLSALHLESFQIEKEANFFIDYMLSKDYSCVLTKTESKFFVSVIELQMGEEKVAV